MPAAVKKLSVPRALVERARILILGNTYELSVSSMDRTRMRALNKTYAQNDTPTDILSFPLSKTSGEIILCEPEVASHARAWDCPPEHYLAYLFIHGMVHLKGHSHGRIMDRLEKKYCHALGVHYVPATHGTKDSRRH